MKGKLVDLIVLTEEIAYHSNWYKWFNDEESTLHMQQHYFPNNKEKSNKIFFNETLKNKKDILQLGILDKKRKNVWYHFSKQY